MTQSEAILKHLVKHGAITPLAALNKYGCLRLAARIKDLREDGHDIQTHIVTQGNRRWARYNLA